MSPPLKRETEKRDKDARAQLLKRGSSSSSAECNSSHNPEIVWESGGTINPPLTFPRQLAGVGS